MSIQDHTPAERIISRIEIRHGADPELRRRLVPIVTQILDSDPAPGERTAMLRLVVRAYASHMRVRTTLDELKDRMRLQVNAVYGRMLGIEPPGVGV